jgi:fatty acid-binding protein DegV
MQRSILTMKDILVKKFAGQTIDLTVHFGDDEEKASQLGSMLQKALSVRTLTISPLTPVLGIHTGPQMFAFVARKV